MQIWVDADACPKAIKAILFRAAVRTKTMTFLVANQPLQIPESVFIKRIRVAAGFDIADNYILKNLQPHDLVVTADILLADAVVDKNSLALNPRGELYTKNNIKQRVFMRNFTAELRDSGTITGGQSKLSEKEIRAFANSLDQLLISS